MLYKIQKSINGKEYPVIVGSDENQSAITADTMIKDSDVFSVLLNSASMKIAVFPNTSVPEIVLTEQSAKVMDITAVYNAISKLKAASPNGEISQSYIQRLREALETKIPDKDQVYAILAITMTYVNNQGTDFTDPVNVALDNIYDEYYDNTKRFIDTLRKESSWPFSDLKPADNVTKFQNTCTDELFVALPNRVDFMESDDDTAFLPDPNEVCRPYGNAELKDMSLYKDPDSGFPRELYPYVEGSKKNNGAPLYPNEEKFHKALIEWVQFNMKADASPDIDVSTSNSNLDKLSQLELENLATFFYARHWSQNINIPVIVDNDEDEDTADDVNSKYSFRMTKDEKAIFSSAVSLNVSDLGVHRQNALLQLTKYLRAASLTVGYRAYVDAIIQLARWGERKPTLLIVDGYALTFSLADNTTKAYVGSASDYDLIKTDGCDSTVISVFYYDTPFADFRYLQKFGVNARCLTAPVGITAEQRYVNRTSAGLVEIRPNVYYSIIDIVKAAMQGSCNVAGIKYENGKFNCDREVTMNRSNTLATVQTAIENSDSFVEPIKVSSSLEDLLMEYDITSRLNHFNVLQQLSRQDELEHCFKRMHFESVNELNDLIKARKIIHKNSAMGSCIGSVILPIVAKVSAILEGKNYSFADVLNAYAEVMAEMHYNSEADFMVSVSNATPLKVESVSEPGNTETKEMNAFGSTPQETQVPSKNPADPVGMVQEEESHLFKKCEKPTVAILLKAPSGKYVGGYYVQQVSTGIVNNGRPVMIQRRYFFDQKTADGLINNPPAGIQRKATHLTSIIPHMLKTLLHYDKKQWNKVTIFFESEETLEYYVEMTTELLRNKEL